MFDFGDRLLVLTDALSRADIPHAFGGAIAYGYHAEPRATADIDLNIFLPETSAEAVLNLVATLGVKVSLPSDAERVRRDAQIRLRWEPIYLDLFFANLPFLESCRDRAVWRRYHGGRIPVLSAEDITVCKLLFNRPKDWVDISRLVEVQGDRLDLEYVHYWLTDMVGTNDGRWVRLNEVIADSRHP